MSRKKAIKELEHARRLINSAKRKLPFGSSVFASLSMLSAKIEDQQIKLMQEDGLR